MVKISVAIITLNEENRIAACIDSVKEIADEILVVDSFSSDRTPSIAEKKGANLIQNKFEGHIQQKNFALEKALYDHVLSLDADEVLSQQALKAVQKMKNSNEFMPCSFKRLTNYCGKWIKHCGWYPDRRIRLVDRKNARWAGENPHDTLVLDQNVNVKAVKADILHYSFASIASHAQTANFFSDIASKTHIEKSKRKVFFLTDIILNPFFTFFKKFFFQLGFLDGAYGFVVCILSSYSNFLKYVKIWNLQKKAL